MAVYRVLSLDTMTGNPVAEISLSGLRYGWKLNAPGTASGTLKLPALRRHRTSYAYLPFTTEDAAPIYVEAGGSPLSVSANDSTSARAKAAALNDAVRANVRQLVVERDGRPLWCGVIARSPYSDASETRQVDAGEHAGVIWSRRFIDRHRTYTNADIFDIVRDIVNKAQAVPGGDIGVTVGDETSGILHTQTYERFDLKPVLEAITQLSSLERGFDWAIEPSWDPDTGALVKRLRLDVRRGRPAAETGLVFELGRNITAFDWDDGDGTLQADKVWATGNGSEEAMLIASAVDSNKLRPTSEGGPGYPLLERAFAYSTVEIQSTLDSHARSDLAVLSNPVALPQITVRADKDPILGSYIVGDACRVRIPPNVSPGLPDGVDTYRRIVAIDVAVSDDGDEQVKLTLDKEP